MIFSSSFNFAFASSRFLPAFGTLGRRELDQLMMIEYPTPSAFLFAVPQTQGDFQDIRVVLNQLFLWCQHARKSERNWNHGRGRRRGRIFDTVRRIQGQNRFKKADM